MRSSLKLLPEVRAEALRRATRRGRANINEAAAILGSSFPTVRNLIDQGEINIIRVGKLRYIPLNELERVRQEWDSLCQRQTGRQKSSLSFRVLDDGGMA